MDANSVIHARRRGVNREPLPDRFRSLLASGSDRLIRTLASCPAEGTNPRSAKDAASSSSSCHWLSVTGILTRRVAPEGRPPPARPQAVDQLGPDLEGQHRTPFVSRCDARLLATKGLGDDRGVDVRGARADITNTPLARVARHNSLRHHDHLRLHRIHECDRTAHRTRTRFRLASSRDPSCEGRISVRAGARRIDRP